MASLLPLTGFRIAVTRPRDQAAPLMRAIEAQGGQPLAFPLLEIEAEPLTPALREQCAGLAHADLLIFISPNAVRYGMAAIRAAGVAFPAGLAFAAVGQSTAQALRELGVAEVIVPAGRYDSEGLLALPALQQIAGRRIVILRGDGGRALLGDTLKARGAEVEYLGCYRRRAAAVDLAALLSASPDAITVTSSEALEHLWAAAAAEAQRDALCAVPLFVPHARIAEKARQQGWREVRATAGGDDGVLAGLVAWATTKGQSL